MNSYNLCLPTKLISNISAEFFASKGFKIYNICCKFSQVCLNSCLAAYMWHQAILHVKSVHVFKALAFIS